MKKTFIVANWKSNITDSEAKKWIDEFKNYDSSFTNKEIIICPSFTAFPILKSYILNLNSPIKIGAQNISPFAEGAYTGEVSGKQIREFADYVLIGHSERRKNFGETDDVLFKKFNLAKESGLIVIYCVQGKETKIPENVDIVAYEPVNAIGTGNPDSPENAEEVGAYFKANFQVSTVLYGGSVTSSNVGSFTKMLNIDGVLVGKASLDPLEFLQISKNA
ncbi:MAG: triose-phosphate isomerase [Candidatus Levybacteria bacterium]|nr:triose-phosphate isomerase [Candidatus Levybacteria bacterium]